MTNPLRVCTRTYKQLYGDEEGEVEDDGEDWEGETWEVPGEDGATVVRGGSTEEIFGYRAASGLDCLICAIFARQRKYMYRTCGYASSALFELNERARERGRMGPLSCEGAAPKKCSGIQTPMPRGRST